MSYIYKLVSNDDVEVFQLDVQNLLNDGYSFNGGISISSVFKNVIDEPRMIVTTYAQALLKFVMDTNK